MAHRVNPKNLFSWFPPHLSARLSWDGGVTWMWNCKVKSIESREDYRPHVDSFLWLITLNQQRCTVKRLGHVVLIRIMKHQRFHKKKPPKPEPLPAADSSFNRSERLPLMWFWPILDFYCGCLGAGTGGGSLNRTPTQFWRGGEETDFFWVLQTKNRGHLASLLHSCWELSTWSNFFHPHFAVLTVQLCSPGYIVWFLGSSNPAKIAQNTWFLSLLDAGIWRFVSAPCVAA